ncbi:MAG: hypothetical protein GXY41_06600 [Phycisphaerae bacterium]|mgnify:CR=1 FL=1|nr:hypothetical protein [Phycisphaerae bacterium]
MVISIPIIVLVVLFETGTAGRYLLTAAGGRVGLDLSAEKVKIGYGGTLRLRRFSAAFSDKESPFFTAHAIDISMNSLADMLTRRDVNVADIRLVNPVLTLRTDEAGQLNILQLAELRRPSAKRPDLEEAEPLKIPAVTLINGTVHYEPFDAEPITVSRIQFDSAVADDEAIALRLSLPGQNTLSGTLHPETLAHTLTLQIENVAALPDPAKTDLPGTFRIVADWHSEAVMRQPFRLAGDLHIRRMTLDGAEAALQATVEIGPETAAAQLRQLRLDPWPLWAQQDEPLDPLTAEQGTITLEYANRSVAVNDLNIALLNGQTEINATLYPQQWNNSRGQIRFDAIDPGPLVDQDIFKDAILSGAVTIEPATDARAMEPMAVAMKLHLAGPILETAGLEEIRANGYLGSTRLVTDDAEIPIFGGRILPWISLTRRNGEFFFHLIADVKDIEVQRVAHTFTGQDEIIPGKLSGTLRGRSSGSLQTLSGSADIALTESDLMNTPIIGAVYSGLNLSFRDLDPKGSGAVKLSAHGEKVEIMSFEYFNRGVEVRGAGAVEAVTRGKESPISGFATGSMRPLRDTPIPGMRELDQLLRGLQVGLASVKIEGTLGDAQPRLVPLPEVQNALRALLWQQRGD